MAWKTTRKASGFTSRAPAMRTRSDSSATVTVLFTSPPRNPVTVMPRGPASFQAT